MAKLDEERQRALEEAGFVAATTEEGLAEAMEAALASMDADIIYAEQQRQKKLAIEKEYDEKEKEEDEKKKAELEAAEKKHKDDMQKAQDDYDMAKETAEKEAANKTADIEYKQAMEDWGMQVAMLPGQIAASIMQGFAQAGPFAGIAGVAIAGTMGAIQLATLMAAMPKKPVPFAKGGVFTGGIVDKPTRFKFAQGGELQEGIMGEAGPEAILPIAKTPDGTYGVNAAGGGQTVHGVSPHDIANFVVQMINAGQTENIKMIRISN
ncbi:hypothetical protein AGMMS49944_24120 [Spirochaetia bacterium]|nr:hypothetical protein AGMMS49944_24120 [Spirochaetia bacterium]